LKIDDSHDLDPVEISPKIINFFNEIKQDYSAVNQEEIPINENMGEDLTEEQTYQNIINKKNKVYQHSLLRSFAAPGWGHLYLSGSSKGWILTTASTAALGSMLYFIYDANQKETDYLNETNKTLIQEKYDEYNTSYKIRNGLIFTYAAIWLYSQIDLLFFSDDQINQKIQTNFGYFPFKSDQFFLSFRIAI
jgi:hypothetical protein